SSSSPTTPIRFRQIRAAYTPTTITVYQAYNKSIATAAVSSQKLDASPHFSLSRMTWIKPSWAWVLYRSGYSYKDSRQTNILAITLTRDAYLGLLRNAVLTHGQVGKAPMKADSVRVQWDPERSMRMGKLRYRSIQIGIPAVRVPEYLEGIVKIEDVTERARELKRVIDEEEKGKGKRASMEELVERGLVPVEREFEVDEELRGILKM
ncbi:ATP-dependent RNA helicase DHX8, partial [Clohesyomyces aquaticus]